MTLFEIVAAYEARHPRPAVIATPKGAAVAAVYRLGRMLGDLDQSDRADVLALLRDELVALPATA